MSHIFFFKKSKKGMLTDVSKALPKNILGLASFPAARPSVTKVKTLFLHLFCFIGGLGFQRRLPLHPIRFDRDPQELLGHEDTNKVPRLSRQEHAGEGKNLFLKKKRKKPKLFVFHTYWSQTTKISFGGTRAVSEATFFSVKVAKKSSQQLQLTQR